jgi:hypothetical protein
MSWTTTETWEDGLDAQAPQFLRGPRTSRKGGQRQRDHPEPPLAVALHVSFDLDTRCLPESRPALTLTRSQISRSAVPRIPFDEKDHGVLRKSLSPRQTRLGPIKIEGEPTFFSSFEHPPFGRQGCARVQHWGRGEVAFADVTPRRKHHAFFALRCLAVPGNVSIVLVLTMFCWQREAVRRRQPSLSLSVNSSLGGGSLQQSGCPMVLPSKRSDAVSSSQNRKRGGCVTAREPSIIWGKPRSAPLHRTPQEFGSRRDTPAPPPSVSKPKRGARKSPVFAIFYAPIVWTFARFLSANALEACSTGSSWRPSLPKIAIAAPLPQAPQRRL